jgi:ABC-2 type transport system ATP-binding protein
VRITPASNRHGDRLTDPIRQVAAVLEASSYHPGRTALDHLRILATAPRLSQVAAMRVLGETALEGNARKRVGPSCLGLRQRLGIAAAMLSGPGALMLDEPTNRVDPPGVRRLRGYLRQLADEGRTVLVCGHGVSEVEQTAHHVLVLAVPSYLKSESSP